MIQIISLNTETAGSCLVQDRTYRMDNQKFPSKNLTFEHFELQCEVNHYHANVQSHSTAISFVMNGTSNVPHSVTYA